MQYFLLQISSTTLLVANQAFNKMFKSPVILCPLSTKNNSFLIGDSYRDLEINLNPSLLIAQRFIQEA